MRPPNGGANIHPKEDDLFLGRWPNKNHGLVSKRFFFIEAKVASRTTMTYRTTMKQSCLVFPVYLPSQKRTVPVPNHSRFPVSSPRSLQIQGSLTNE